MDRHQLADIVIALATKLQISTSQFASIVMAWAIWRENTSDGCIVVSVKAGSTWPGHVHFHGIERKICDLETPLPQNMGGIIGGDFNCYEHEFDKFGGNVSIANYLTEFRSAF